MGHNFKPTKPNDVWYIIYKYYIYIYIHTHIYICAGGKHPVDAQDLWTAPGTYALGRAKHYWAAFLFLQPPKGLRMSHGYDEWAKWNLHATFPPNSCQNDWKTQHHQTTTKNRKNNTLIEQQQRWGPHYQFPNHWFHGHSVFVCTEGVCFVQGAVVPSACAFVPKTLCRPRQFANIVACGRTCEIASVLLP